MYSHGRSGTHLHFVR